MDRVPPPPPGLPQAPIVSTDEIRVGDVVQVAVQLVGSDGKSYWWKRFAVVTDLIGRWSFEALNLKMHPNRDPSDFLSDCRMIFLKHNNKDRPQVVTKLREPWPQGVAAMYMKYLAKGWIKLEN